ncbi:MAG: cell wall anchor protein, partial [Actinobacteria bacterium]|nr:cell wall anchor protein [Actinomycetota bacterium]
MSGIRWSRARAASVLTALALIAIMAGAAPGARAETSAPSLLAWGANETSQLGDGSTAAQRPTPAPVTLAPGPAVNDISGGTEAAAAVTSTGQALAWGSNEYGQLGDGTTTLRSTPVPVRLPPGTKATGVAVGSN